MRPFEDFEAIAVQVEETHIFLRRFGSGPAVLLLHGFPQTHLMWRSVAPAGHLFPEEIPERTAEELGGFFATTC
jgi:hypothetical protein